jgi:hypothetical protein
MARVAPGFPFVLKKSNLILIGDHSLSVVIATWLANSNHRWPTGRVASSFLFYMFTVTVNIKSATFWFAFALYVDCQAGKIDAS